MGVVEKWSKGMNNHGAGLGRAKSQTVSLVARVCWNSLRRCDAGGLHVSSLAFGTPSTEVAGWVTLRRLVQPRFCSAAAGNGPLSSRGAIRPTGVARDWIGSRAATGLEGGRRSS
jgi:hypothetical protein